MNPSKLAELRIERPGMARLTLPLAVAAMLTAACGTTQPDPALVAARQSVQNVGADPNVNRFGQAEFNRAREALRRAEAAAADGDEREARHAAYLAQQAAATATAAALGRAGDERVNLASAERERMRLEARTQEAAAAQRQAQAAQQQAQSYQQQAQTEAQRASQLQRELSDLAGKQTDRGMVVTLSDVLFDTGRAELRSGSRRTLERLAEVLKKHPERRVSIEGFTDSQGGDGYNMELSRRRAESVRQALVEQGVEAARAQVRPYGEAFPVATNDTPAGRQRNRRVEIVVSDQQGQVRER